jgi:hypothetical protein
MHSKIAIIISSSFLGAGLKNIKVVDLHLTQQQLPVCLFGFHAVCILVEYLQKSLWPYIRNSLRNAAKIGTESDNLEFYYNLLTHSNFSLRKIHHLPFPIIYMHTYIHTYIQDSSPCSQESNTGPNHK